MRTHRTWRLNLHAPSLHARLILGCCLILLTGTGCGPGNDTLRLFAPQTFDGPRAVGGVIDLRNADLELTIPLDGEWLFYQAALVTPADLADVEAASVSLPEPEPIPVPATWNRQTVSGRPLGGQGFGTYRLDVLLDPNDHPLFLKTAEISTAFRLYVDDELQIQGGEVGTDAASTRPEWVTAVVSFVPTRERTTILVQVANFHHARGGLRDEIVITRDAAVTADPQARRNLSYFVFGALLVMGIYHLGLIAVRTREYSTLWFGLVAILMAIRTLLTGQPAVLQATTLPMWEFFLTIEYFTMYAGFTLFFLYTAALFPQEMHASVRRTVCVVGGALAALAVFTSARVFSASVVVFHVLALGGSVYLIVVALRAWRAGRVGSIVYAVGMVFLALTVLNDVLYNIGFWRTGYFANVGLLVFLFFQSLVLASRFGANVRRIEELLAERSRLEGLSFRDGLTGISNRRHFDITLAKEWTRAQRHGQPLSLIMVDIDAFKKYNDNYGHLNGDDALKQVAHALYINLHRSADFVARYGGEEFAVILPSTDHAGATTIAESMRVAVENLGIEHHYADTGTVLTASFGVASRTPSRDTDCTVLLEDADRALYLAKQRCKNCVV